MGSHKSHRVFSSVVGVAHRFNVLRGAMISAAFVAIMGFTPHALAESHDYINMMRSGSESHLFVSQGVEGEFGDYAATGSFSSDQTASTYHPASQKWQGYNFRTGVGVELMKFVQFCASHTFVNMHSAQDRLENLQGSRVALETRFVFLSPIGNLELGAGATGARLDYQHKLDNESFYGTGYFYDAGVNYYLSERVSFFGNVRQASEHLASNGGSGLVGAFQTNTTALGLGFSLWL